jgi:hypothetical protein
VNEAEWYMVYEAPKDKVVLVWVPPVVLSPAITEPARFEVGIVHRRDPRSGQYIQKYPNTARWTPLPRAPRRRTKRITP